MIWRTGRGYTIRRAHPVIDAYPALSADGHTWLFQSNRSGRWTFYLSDPDGRNVHTARTWEADDWSWEYGHIVMISVDDSAR